MAKRTAKRTTKRPSATTRAKWPSTTKRPRAVPEEIPPGATRKALDRPLDPGGSPPGSGAGPRHAAGDPGSDIESYGSDDTGFTAAEPFTEEQDPLEKGPPYAGITGGAVGGTPAEGRSTGGRIKGGITPGPHRGDSTIGTDPELDANQQAKKRESARRRRGGKNAGR